MSRTRIHSLPLLATLAFAACAALPSVAAAAEDPGVASIYDPGAVGVVELTLSPEAIVSLENEPDEDVKGIFSFATTDGSPGGVETTLTPSPINVEVHLKGSVGGSFRPITEKAAFKVKFKKTATFLGLRKMTLNNMVQDDSMIHEALAYATFAAAGVPSSRSGYAYVRVNGEDFGLYADIETLDNIALEKRFGAFEDPQHLYEGEKGHDVLAGEAGSFEVDEGNEADVSDLEALIDAVAYEGEEPWATAVAPYIDLEEMTRMWAVEKYIDHWDGYSGHALAGLRPNNYYLYADASGRFQMLPWGTDQTYIPTIGVGTPQREVTFDGAGGVLFDKCLEDEACSRLYWEALSEVTDAVAALDPGTIATDTAALLEPWEELEREEGRPQFTGAQVEEGVETTLDFIAGRGAEANAWLQANEPPEEAETPGSEQPGTPARPGASAPNPDANPLPLPVRPQRLRLGRVQRDGKFLGVHLDLPRAGSVRMVATMRTRGSETQACAARLAFPRDGAVVVHCKLTQAALARLAERPLRLSLAATLSSLDLLAATRVITLQRD